MSNGNGDYPLARLEDGEREERPITVVMATNKFQEITGTRIREPPSQV